MLLIPIIGLLAAGRSPIDRHGGGRAARTREGRIRDALHPGRELADGLPPGEGAFLACSFWLVNDLALIGRRKEAEALFERLLALRNDLGLFSEEYDQPDKQLIGNMPQAFTHLTLIASAIALGESGHMSPLGDVATVAPPWGDQFELRLGDRILCRR